MPIDLAEPATETAQMDQMRAEQEITPAPEAVVEKPAPEPMKAEEPVKAEPPKEAPEKGEGHNVPLPVLLEERRQRKASDAALKEAREALAELRKGTPKPETPLAPDAQTDPIAVIERQQKWIAEREQQDSDRARMGEFQSVVVQREQEFIKDNPDYPKAVEFLKEARTREMRDGLGLTDQQIGQALAQEAAQTAAYALQNDLNPAEVFMRLAKVRGYAAAAPEPTPEPVIVQPDPAAVAKLASLAKGIAAGKTGAVGGGAALGAPSLEAISKLEGADFDAAWKSGKVKELMN